MRTSGVLRAISALVCASVCSAGECRAPAFEWSCNTDGIVKGLVLFGNDARIPNATIVIEGPVRKETTSNEFGEYQFNVPPGVYKITAEVDEWYYTVRRAAFRVTFGSVIRINLRPRLRILSIGIAADHGGVREPIDTAPPPRYDYYPSVFPKDRGLDLMVQFKSKSHDRAFVYYEDAVVTYDSLTIVAHKSLLNRKTLAVDAEGNVMIETALEVIQAERVSVDIRSRTVRTLHAF